MLLVLQKDREADTWCPGCEKAIMIIALEYATLAVTMGVGGNSAHLCPRR
jgi:hypothetical protein